MKKNIIFTFLILIFLNWTAYSQVSSDSLMRFMDEFKIRKNQTEIVRTKMQYISTNTTKVQVLQTCSTNPENCGVMAFASTTMAKIINGKYSGDTILIAVACYRTFYKTDNIYTLNVSFPPAFGVALCSGDMYNSDWNYNLDTNKYLIFFGRLVKKGLSF